MIVVQDTLLSQSTSLSEDHLIPKTVSGIQLFSSPTGGLDSTARASIEFFNLQHVYIR